MGLKEEISLSYLQLKREVYYDNSNLFLRESIAKFEKNGFNVSIENCSKQLEQYLLNPKKHEKWFLDELDSIKTYILPKKLQNSRGASKLITNVREKDQYVLKDVFYYFSGSIPLFIISTLWTRIVGFLLDSELSNDCYGNRLENIQDSSETKYSKLFKTYFRQYGYWRDKAVEEGLHQLEQKQNILLIALDLKQCYLRLETDWSEIQKLINKRLSGHQKTVAENLCDALKAIHERYNEEIKDYIKTTYITDADNHQELPNGRILPVGLPIGLPSSGIIANWELRKFDDLVKEKVRPVYYGRYVDDILFVLNVPNLLADDLDTPKLINKFLVENKVLINVTKQVPESEEQKNLTYKVEGFNYLLVQSDKTIVHYYQHDHSWAGLKEFKEEIRKRSSEFRFLPTEDEYKTLSDEAYDLQYDGSIYKFRSLIGITENQNKLAQFLYKQQLKAWLTLKKIDKNTIRDLFLFYKGTNILDYLRTWEKIFTLLIVSSKEKEFIRLWKKIEITIKKLVYISGNFESINNEISGKVREDTKHFLSIATAMSVAYLSKSDIENLSLEEEIKELAYLLRAALLLRHQNIIWPLLEYADYSNSLVLLDFTALSGLQDIPKSNLVNATRYIHPDDEFLFQVLIQVLRLSKTGTLFKTDRPFYAYPNGDISKLSQQLKKMGINLESNPPKDADEMSYCNNAYTFALSFEEGFNSNPNNLCIGVANVKIDKDRLQKCMISAFPLLDSYQKQNTLFDLINVAEKEPKCDLIVFPEVYIPFGWLPFMVAQSRKHQIGFIFGLEHVNIGSYSLNLLATLLPYKDENNFSRVYPSVRLKNHYSPREEYELERHFLKRPDLPYLYEKFHWHDIVFTSFNCFELTDILHRGLFRSDIDLLAAVEYNKDINYYSNILESVVRDVHCFAVQANTAEFGDSRIIAPKSTEEMNFVRVKGGENSVLLKSSLPVKELREFQIKKYDPLDKRFKPTPAGFDHFKAKKRK